MTQQPSSAAQRRPALVLIGPPGAGKTPLGDLLEGRGLDGRTCRHFDFGRELRRAAGAGAIARLGGAEAEFVRHVLACGALLDDEHFPLAERILLAFIERCALREDDLLVLNGLPRHVGQAVALEPHMRVEGLAHLDCTPDVAAARIRSDTGGDRAGRPADDAEVVQRRLADFAARTLPLVEHYAARGARIVRIPVGPATTAEEARQLLTESLREANEGAPLCSLHATRSCC